MHSEPAGQPTGGVATAERGEVLLLVYFSSVSENTHRFVEKLGLRTRRIPVQGELLVDEPFVLVTPTYGGGKITDPSKSGFVPKQVIRFLNNKANRSRIRGVIAAGNTNFGEEFCYAGDIIAAKCQVPYLYRFELMGTEHDVMRVREGLASFTEHLGQQDQQSHPSRQGDQ